MFHAQSVLERIEASGVTLYRLSKETGISQSLFSKWKKNPDTYVTSQNLVLIADYLGCSIDYLLSRKQASIPLREALSQEEEKLVSDFRQLNDEGQFKLTDYADDLVSSGKYTKEKTISAG